MAKNTKSNPVPIPRFTIEKVKTGTKAIGKLSVPNISVNDLGDTIGELLQAAKEGGLDVSRVRGTISLY